MPGAFTGVRGACTDREFTANAQHWVPQAISQVGKCSYVRTCVVRPDEFLGRARCVSHVRPRRHRTKAVRTFQRT